MKFVLLLSILFCFGCNVASRRVEPLRLMKPVVCLKIYATEPRLEKIRPAHATAILISVTTTHDEKNKYVFLTAGHALNRGGHVHYLNQLIPIQEKFAVEVSTRNEFGEVTGVLEIKEDEENLFVIERSSQLDLGLLSLITPEKLEITVAEFTREHDSEQLEVGEHVYSVSCLGFPTPTYREGVVSMISDDDVVIDMHIGGGASGGPAYNDDEKVVGVLHAMHTAFMARMIPMKSVYAFLKETDKNGTRTEDQESVRQSR
jgi:hypothetical protein